MWKAQCNLFLNRKWQAPKIVQPCHSRSIRLLPEAQVLFTGQYQPLAGPSPKPPLDSPLAVIRTKKRASEMRGGLHVGHHLLLSHNTLFHRAFARVCAWSCNGVDRPSAPGLGVLG